MTEWLSGIPIDGADTSAVPMLTGPRRIIVTEYEGGIPHVLVRLSGDALVIVQRIPKAFRSVGPDGEPGPDNTLVVATSPGLSLEALEDFLAFLQEDAEFGPADVVRDIRDDDMVFVSDDNSR